MGSVAEFPPAARLSGTLTPPPDKSISHRAALLAGMSDGPVRITNYLRAADTSSTLEAVRKLGAQVETQGEPNGGQGGLDIVVRGVGLRGARGDVGEIDVGNAGTLMRLLPGWLAGQDSGQWTLDGDASIRRRPIDRVADPLREMGAKIECRDGRFAPMQIEAAPLHGIEYELPVASAQVKSCLLIAGLLARGKTTVIEHLPSRDHTEIMLRGAGASVVSAGDRVTVEPAAGLTPGSFEVPGDISSAAFFIVAATLVPGSELLLKGVSLNPTRTGLLDVLERMGASVERSDVATKGGEPVGDLVVHHAELRGTLVEPREVPRVIDELPLVALVGAFAQGATIVRGAEELRHKESDRVATVVGGLRELGATIEETADGFAVQGSGSLRGGRIDSHGDHRLAMLGAIAGIASHEGVEVHGFEAAGVSYPGFLEDLAGVI